MKDNVKLDATYPHPPERVWEALTDPKALSKWLMPTDFRPLIGFRFRLERPDANPITGKVTDVEEGQLLAYTWNDEDEGQESLVIWRIDPVDGGTRVQVEHVQLETAEVTRIPIDAYFNWSYALRHGLPGLLEILKHTVGAPR